MSDPVKSIRRSLKALLSVVFIGASCNCALAQYNIGTGSAMDLYQESCAGCHGARLEGGSAGSLIDDRWSEDGSDEALTRAIRDGLPGTAMPAWEAAFTPEQIRSLVILIREQRESDRLKALEKANTVQSGAVFESDLHAFTLEPVIEVAGILWAVDFLADGSLLTTQLDGALWHVKDGERTSIADLPRAFVASQGGLLDVYVHERANEEWVYLSYSEKSDRGAMTAVVRGKIEDGRWVEQQDIFRVPLELHIDTTYHYGSRLAVAGDYLFFSVGDRGQQDMAQDLGRPNGKIHRVHLDGSIPDDNPFRHEGQYASVWSYGHRNPQGMDAHPVTGAIWAAEHGPRGGDEVNHIQRARNYGWPRATYGMSYDGTAMTATPSQPQMEEPARYWTPSISPGGIAFYEGDQFPNWKGSLFVGGMGARELHRLTLEGSRVVGDETVMSGQGRVRDVVSADDGHLYVLLNNPDPASSGIYRLVPAQRSSFKNKESNHAN